MPSNGLRRNSPSAVAHDSDPRRISQRADTVESVAPANFQRRIAATATEGVSAVSRTSASGASAIKNLLTERCEFTVAGFYKCGAST